jgi:hypothetical protein
MSLAAGSLDSLFSGQVTTAVQVSAVPVDIGAYQILNTTAAIAYVQVFYRLAADVTLGTTAPDVAIPLPASGGATLNFSGSGWRTRGRAGSNGLTIASTTSPTNATTALSHVVLWKCR